MTTYVKVKVDVADTYRLKVIYAIANVAEKVIWAEPGVEQTITFEAGKEDTITLTRENV